METDPDTVLVGADCARCDEVRTCIRVGNYSEDPIVYNALCLDCMIELSLFLSRAIKEAEHED